MTARLLIVLAAGTLLFHLAHDATGFGGRAFADGFALWFQPAVFLGCGVATLLGALRLGRRRLPWLVLGTGLLIYGLGSVVYNVAYDQAVPPYPSAADLMWLALPPAGLFATALLLRQRFTRLAATDWLDGVIGGAVVAGFVAALCFEPVFDVAAQAGAGAAAQFAYPVADLSCFGFVVMVWCLRSRRPDTVWLLLGAGFALLAIADSVYVVEAANGTWAPGGLFDLPYAVATMLLAAAAWNVPSAEPANRALMTPRVYIPSAFALGAVSLAAIGVMTTPNPLTGTLTLIALVAVVLRFGLTLHSLTRQRRELAALAATDPLTGLANHRTLHERLVEEVERADRTGRPVSVVALDLDHFKAVNDTFGHAEGDAALQAVARTLESVARPYDLVGRMGGEEFTLIVPGADADEALAMAERCRLALLGLTVGDQPISCSAGVASFPADGPHGQRLFELADGALYVAKQAGRAQVRRYDASQSMLLSRAEQQAQIRELLEREDALTMVFQPIVELTTGRIGGYEALTRFLHTDPVRPPDQWFAQARRCDMGPELEARAIAAALAVPGRPPGAFLSINVSPSALLSPEVAAVLPDDLTSLVIELTEDERFTTDRAFDLALESLRERGARIAVDDAGAGYAGLQQLVRIKPEILKLDRSLIQGIQSDEAKIALLDALARFATSTGAAVCAEGIEELPELGVLGRFDVTYAQGYALGRPAAPWSSVPEQVLAAAAAEQRWGMRVVALGDGGEEALFGDVLDVLSRVTTYAELDEAMALTLRHANAEEIAVSRVHADERCVETLSEHTYAPSGKLFSYDDFPTTERVLTEQVLGQVVDGDAAADEREVALLRESGFGSVLMVPIVFRSETVGLLELYRRIPQPWMPAEIARARLIGHQLAAMIGVPESLRA